MTIPAVGLVLIGAHEMLVGKSALTRLFFAADAPMIGVMDRDAHFIAELNERLFTHFTGGHWRVPLAQRHLPVYRAGGGRLGQIICADGRDVARALADLNADGTEPPTDTMRDALSALTGQMARIRTEEGFADPGHAATELAIDAAATLVSPGAGPVVLMSAADTPPGLIGAALVAFAGHGVIWKPAPRAAASAHLLMRYLGPLAAGRLALLQGDHVSGAALAASLRGAGALIWASPAPLPDLPLPVRRLAAG